MVSPDPLTYSIILVDIEGFSPRPTAVQATLQTQLYDVVRFALERAHVGQGDYLSQDRGDGVLLLLPPVTSPTLLLREFVRGLQDALVEHNAAYQEGHRMRLRVGLHQGPVTQQGQSWASTAINDLARLVDADPVKGTLAEARRAHLVVVVSEEIYGAVVLGGYAGIDSAAYLPADFVTKHGEKRRGWVTVPGYAAPPGLPSETGEPPAEPEQGLAAGGETEGRTDGAGNGGAAPSVDRSPAPAPVPAPASRQVWAGGDYVEGSKNVTINTSGPVRS